MEYEEENIKQEELEKDKDESQEDESKSEEQDEEDTQEEEEIMPKKPKSAGLLLTIFGAVLVTLIGGLAYYYYYTFQEAGRKNEQALINVWDETVLSTITLTNKFDQMENFDQLGEDGNDNFESYVNDANRTVRDNIFDVRSQTGLDVTAGTFASKLHGFLDDYSSMLGEMKRIVARVEDIESEDELSELLNYADDMEESYDELILVSGDFIQANLPRDIFDMPGDIRDLLNAKLEENGTLEEQEKADRQAAEKTASQFVQAWKDRDAEAMTELLTAGAKTDFNPGILEASSDIVRFRITSTKFESDASILVNGKIDLETPDEQEVTEDWSFTLIKTNDKWLIDTWSQVNA